MVPVPPPGAWRSSPEDAPARPGGPGSSAWRLAQLA